MDSDDGLSPVGAMSYDGANSTEHVEFPQGVKSSESVMSPKMADHPQLVTSPNRNKLGKRVQDVDRLED